MATAEEAMVAAAARSLMDAMMQCKNQTGKKMADVNDGLRRATFVCNLDSCSADAGSGGRLQLQWKCKKL